MGRSKGCILNPRLQGPVDREGWDEHGRIGTVVSCRVSEQGSVRVIYITGHHEGEEIKRRGKVSCNLMKDESNNELQREE